MLFKKRKSFDVLHAETLNALDAIGMLNQHPITPKQAQYIDTLLQSGDALAEYTRLDPFTMGKVSVWCEGGIVRINAIK